MVLKQMRRLLNGGFESGEFSPGWQASGELHREIVSVPTHSENHAALLGDPNYENRGGCPVGEAAIHQVIDVPASGHPCLRLWYRIYSYDTVDWDYFGIDIMEWPKGPNQNLRRVGCPSWEWTGTRWDSTWRELEIILDDYRGQTIKVEFYNVMTNEDGWYNTWTYVDDVALEKNP